MAVKRTIAFVLLATLLMTIGSVSVAQAVDLGSVLEAFGIAYAVRIFSSQINSFVNTLLLQRGVEWEGATKVVPIISIGSGAYVGAAQVVGPSSSVQRVAAVGQGELGISNQRIRLKTLIPLSTTNPTRGISRVGGVGVSAIIDFRI